MRRNQRTQTTERIRKESDRGKENTFRFNSPKSWRHRWTTLEKRSENLMPLSAAVISLVNIASKILGLNSGWSSKPRVWCLETTEEKQHTKISLASEWTWDIEESFSSEESSKKRQNLTRFGTMYLEGLKRRRKEVPERTPTHALSGQSPARKLDPGFLGYWRQNQGLNNDGVDTSQKAVPPSHGAFSCECTE